ncbi:MAG: AAA family ATPase [Pirellulaceae bacterium]
MSITEPGSGSLDLLATILSDEAFRPNEPASISETGLPLSLIESLICKRLLLAGRRSGRQLAEELCMPFNLIESLYQNLRSRQIIVHQGSAPLNDYIYTLTETGRDRANQDMATCAYVGPAPVPLMDYVLSAEAQTIRAECPKENQLIEAFRDISINTDLFENLGPAINSGAGLFLYGEPGNGKSTLARKITQCFGQQIWIPHAIFEDGQIIKLYDAAFHEESGEEKKSILKDAAYDRRWVKIKRPTVVVGGELTLDSLEIRHDDRSNVSEASLQMKSNCGCLLIDDFGRQRIEPTELLNRWIVPLESRIDFLTLASGKKIQVPFEQLIIFSTNLEPADLVDEAFLRRIPYKIEIGDPSIQEFHRLFQIYCPMFKCHYDEKIINYLLEKHYLARGRAMRRCHPRDLLGQIRNFCAYKDLPMEILPEYFDRVVKSYFTIVIGNEGTETAAAPARSQD